VPRQRVRERPSALVVIGRVVVVVLALGLIWYGAMVVLLAVKVSPSTVNHISGYRTAFDWLSGLTPAKVDGAGTRAIVAGAGIAAFLIFGFLAFKQLPRPYLARRDLPLSDDAHGEVIVEPRAIERLAELAAGEHRDVIGVRGRYSVDDLSIDLEIRRAGELADTLRDAQRRVVEALEQHELPTMPINVTLTGYERRHKRELH
jgi:hypothetical protein